MAEMTFTERLRDPAHKHQDPYTVDLLFSAADEIERLCEALNRVASPLEYLQKDAERDGVKLNGAMAVRLSEDHTHLKAIAKSALNDGGKYYAPLSSDNADAIYCAVCGAVTDGGWTCDAHSSGSDNGECK
jgi:hypothetical protein